MSRRSVKPTARSASHRFRFQLAPLVDLLLIIVFAQFLEVRTSVKQQTDALKQQIAAASQKLQSVESAQDAAMSRLQEERKQMADTIGTVASLFDIPTAKIESYAVTGDQDVTELLKQVAARSKALSAAAPEKIIRFLVGHEELLKRAEIWNLHAGGDRRVSLLVGARNVEFTLERVGQDLRREEFTDELFAAYKKVPQPKELVVILVSYSPDAVAGVYQPMIDGTPAAIERMRADDPTTRFEYTVLGATASPQNLSASSKENVQ